jgi:hypothetical protein
LVKAALNRYPGRAYCRAGKALLGLAFAALQHKLTGVLHVAQIGDIDAI